MAWRLITRPNGHRGEAHGGAEDRERAGVSAAHAPLPPRVASRFPTSSASLQEAVAASRAGLKVLRRRQIGMSFSPPFLVLRSTTGAGELCRPRFPTFTSTSLLHGRVRSLAPPSVLAPAPRGLSRRRGSRALWGATWRGTAVGEQKEARSRQRVKSSSPGGAR